MSSILNRLGFQKPDELDFYVRVLLFGGPFTGKTAAMMSMPKAIFIGAEKGIVALARTVPRNQATGEPLPWFEKPMMVKEFDDARDAYNTISELYTSGALKDPDGMLDGAQCLCVDANNKFIDMFSEEYDKVTGRLNTKEGNSSLFASGEYKWNEMSKKKRPINTVLNLLSQAKMHVAYTSHAQGIFEITGNKMKKKGDKARSGKDVDHNIDVIIQMLNPDPSHEDAKYIPHGTPDEERAGWFLVHKDRYHVFQRFKVYHNFIFKQYIQAAKANMRESGGKPVDPENPPSAQETVGMEHQNDQDVERKLNLIMSNQRVMELASSLDISAAALQAGIRDKYNYDMNAVIAGLEAALKKRKG